MKKNKNNCRKKIFTFAEKRDILINLINSIFVFFITLITSVLVEGFEWTWLGFTLACIFGLLQAIYNFKSFLNQKFMSTNGATPKVLAFVAH